MTKAEFVTALREAEPDLFPSKAMAEKALAIFCDILSEAAVSPEGVRLPRVGRFSLTQRAARTGRNPKTGAPIHIPPRNAIKFTPSPLLTDKIEQ